MAMAGETTQGHATWITVGAGAVLAGTGVIVTNALASLPNRRWHWVGISLIVVGILTMVAALCHQFRHKLLPSLRRTSRTAKGLAALLADIESIILSMRKEQELLN
jgi:uncharacterized membrane protein HdeD (DUF308 family)